MSELKLYAPTYYGNTHPPEVKPEFDEPYVPVLVRQAEGVRIVLGTHDYFDSSKPDVQIERRLNGWMVFLHPVGGSDPSGLVCFLDDGRSFVVPAEDSVTTPAIVVQEHDYAAIELDGPAHVGRRSTKSTANRKESCGLCSQIVGLSDDSWGGLCGRCADKVSAFIDDNGLTTEVRDEIVLLLRRNRLQVKM